MLEIDVACQATAADRPTAIPNLNCKQEMGMNPDQEMRKKGKFDANLTLATSTRQTTLDKFIGVSSCNSRKFDEKAGISCGQRTSNSIGNNICEETEKLNEFVKIDVEAAKTWIYPGIYYIYMYIISFFYLFLFICNFGMLVCICFV